MIRPGILRMNGGERKRCRQPEGPRPRQGWKLEENTGHTRDRKWKSPHHESSNAFVEFFREHPGEADGLVALITTRPLRRRRAPSPSPLQSERRAWKAHFLDGKTVKCRKLSRKSPRTGFCWHRPRPFRSLLWDYSWESTVGIDYLWAPPHAAGYAAVLLAG